MKRNHVGLIDNPENSVITEMTSHFFLEQLEKTSLEIPWKLVEIVQITFKQMHNFLTDDNLITTLCSVYIPLYQSIAYLLIDIES